VIFAEPVSVSVSIEENVADPPVTPNEPVILTLPVNVCVSFNVSPNLVEPDENDSVK